MPGAEIVAEPIINQGLVRFLDPKAGASDADHDRRTDQVIAEIVAERRGLFRRNHLSRPAGDARQRLQLADFRRRCPACGERGAENLAVALKFAEPKGQE